MYSSSLTNGSAIRPLRTVAVSWLCEKSTTWTTDVRVQSEVVSAFLCVTLHRLKPSVMSKLAYLAKLNFGQEACLKADVCEDVE